MLLVVTNCVFEDNTAEEFGGGAVSCRNNTEVDIRNTTFKGNNASYGGAIVTRTQSLFRVINCTFADNHAEIVGGALLGAVSTILEISATHF